MTIWFPWRRLFGRGSPAETEVWPPPALEEAAEDVAERTLSPVAAPVHVRSGSALIRIDNGVLVVEREGEPRFERPVELVSAVHIHGWGTITSPCVAELVRQGTPVVWRGKTGYPIGWAAAMHQAGLEARRAQYAAAGTARALAVAQALVRAKIVNMRGLVRRRAALPGRECLETLHHHARQAERAETIDTLLGIEGTATARYFAAWPEMISARAGDLSFGIRSRRPPRDEVNALLSYTYAVLAGECLSACVAAGLDPRQGFLHRPRAARPALALDLMEPFRPLIADQAVLTGLNHGQVKEEHFAAEGYAVLLSESGRQLAIDLMERRFLAAVTLEGLEHAVLRLSLRLVRFDAAVLRRLAAARDAVGDRRPQSRVEALRHLSEAIPTDAVMSDFLNERVGVELSLAVHTEAPLGAAAQRMLCHAAFRTEPETDAPAEGNLGSVYPRGFVLGQTVAGLAAVALLSFQRAPAVYEPPPAVAGAPGLTIGCTADGRPVVITEADRALHQFIIGATGTGKSTLLLNQIAADMRAGEGMLVLDPHGDLWEASRRLVPPAREKDVVLAHLGDPQHAFTMNVLAGLGGDPAIERSATINGLIRLMKNTLWPDVQEAFGPMFELYFRNALLLLMEAQGDAATILDFERLFIDEDFRDELLGRCGTQSVCDFWRKTAAHVRGDHSLENLVPYIVCKLAPFTANKLLAPMLGSPTSSLDIKAAVADGRIVLINLAKGIIGAGSARLVGGLITMRLAAAAQTQMVLPYEARRPFVAYLDEFQTYADEHISEAIEETRKYRLRLVLACQSLSQIDGRNRRADVGASILANVANLVSFRLGVGDAHTLAPWFQPMVKPEDLMYLPNHVAVGRLLVGGQAIRPVEFRTAPPPSACGGPRSTGLKRTAQAR